MSDQQSRPAWFDDGILNARPKLHAFAVRLCGDRAPAEDLVQQTMMKAMENFHHFQEGTNQAAWLFTIMRNEFYSRHRKASREVEDVDGIFAGKIPVGEGQSSAYDLKVIRKRMRMLNSIQRRAVEMVAILGEDYETAAERLGIPVGTVKSAISRARDFLETGVMVVEDLEPLVEQAAVIIGPSDQIASMYRSGASVSEIAAAVGMKRSEVMRVITDLKVKRP